MEFTRQPRILPEYQIGEIEIESPPTVSEKPEVSWFSILIAPIITVSATVFVFMASQSSGMGFMSNPIFLASSVVIAMVSIVGSLLNYNHQMSKYKNQKTEREKKYRQYIKDRDRDLAIASKQQSDALRKLHPDTAGCINLMLNQSPSLWERTASYEDFLMLRVGIGAAKTAFRVAQSSARDPGVMNTDPLAGEPKALALKYDTVQEVPICVDFKEAQICGIAGSNDRVVDLINNMLIQLVTHHGYDDIRVVILTQEQSVRKWGWMRFLPHLWNDEFQARYFLCGKDMAGNMLSDLCAFFKEREKKIESGAGISGEAHYMFVVDNPSVLEGSQIKKYIYEPNIKLGIAVIFTAEQMSFLPAGCGTVITLKEKTAEKTDRINKTKTTFLPDLSVYEKSDIAARKIAPLRIRAAVSSYSLPKSITLSQMLNNAGALSGKDLTKVDILENWQKNRTYNGMSVPIGAGIGGIGSGTFYLDLHETGHGPHGLVAGTTGSGKSELLQSIIISLAINFHPHDVTFVLIDYKGGGMADVFKGMPHLAGVITNLSGRQTMRALLSIKGEILRRQTVFAKYGVNNIDKYQRLYYRNENPEMLPISHLILIADEFAELKQDQPEFMKELVSAARVGRSLGIHLILATQKPDGVVDDQIWSNSKFKLCLKVQTESDSNGVLKKPDAAFIKEPGRAYLQVGNDEIYELFQSAYSGADYLPEEKKQNVSKNIYLLSLDGKQTKVYPAMTAEKPADEQKNPTQLEAMVEHIKNVSEVEPMEGPWTPPLEEKMYLNEVDLSQKPQGTFLSALAGKVDDPRGQRKFPLELDFFNDGNLLVYGMPGSGKSCLLRTICLSLSMRYTPDEINIYILDMNGTGFKMFEKLPHCGGVLTIDNSVSIRQFSRYLLNSINQRKKLFETNDAENFSEYRKNNMLPAILVVIDNYLGLSESYDDVDEQLLNMVREGSKYGIYFVITALSDYGIRYKMSINFKMVIAFQLVDKASYYNLVGRTEGLEPEDYPGRALVRLASPFEMHAFLPEFKEDTVIKQTKDIIEEIASKETRRAVPIPIMPDKLSISKLNLCGEDGGEAQGEDKACTEIVIGLADSDLSPVSIDFSEYVAFMITGEPGCGKSTLACVWLNFVKNGKIYFMDSNGMGLMKIASNDNTVDLSEADLEEIIASVTEIIDSRRQELNALKRSGGDVKTLIDSWEQIIFAFDKFSEFSENFDYEDFKDLLIRIINKERGLKIMILALDTLDGFSGDYENVTKYLKKEQAGVMLGSLKDQNVFDCRLPYGTIENEYGFGDGFFVRKTKYIGFRAAY
ncbi:MAG: type VII secretion protein EssC [Clostridiales bacterium]|jgi:S-DNA-T family DNA segregation ATPase FtsK/SpoIIIE|nr:type VII secretion protein EssC [Clostridiales bacterium]